MPRIKNHKPFIILLVIILFVLSVSVFLAPDMKAIKRVQVRNRAITISQGNTEIIHSQVGVHNNAKIQNEDLESLNKDLHFNNSDKMLNHKIKYKNTDSFDNIASKNIKFNHTDTNNSNFKFQNSARYAREMQKYKYQDINWGTWKSRFVNRILDDSLYIKSLDTYGMGTWFYYSFVVTNTGEIHDVTVFSLYLNDEDKMQIRALIRSYEKMPITIFPANSKRKKAKIKAIMLLGDTEQKANSSNFMDTERVKVHY